MPRTKKISDRQFILDCINKEFEIIGENLHWDTFEELSAWTKLPENICWFSNYEFNNKEQYNQWKDYYVEHFYSWQSKRISKRYVEEHCFPYFSLMYGFAERWEK